MNCTIISNTGNIEALAVGRTYRYCHAGGCCTLVPEKLPGDTRIGLELPVGIAYGRLVGAMGMDEEADCYISYNLASPNVYAIRQMRQLVEPIPGQTHEFDEFKFMFGFASAVEAMKAYRSCTHAGMFGGIQQIAVSQIWDTSKEYDLQ